MADRNDNQASQSRTVNEEPLPYGWEMRVDRHGRHYYVDNNTRTSQWELPAQLPDNWEQRVDCCGRVYYVDHNTRDTVWFQPNGDVVNNRAPWQQNRTDRRWEDNARRFLISLTRDGKDEYEDPLGPLPEGWTRRGNKKGRVYFVNHKTKTTQWADPRTQGMEREKSMPEGWEVKYTREGMCYFVDHNTKTVTYQDPRYGAADDTIGTGAVPITYERNFRWKLRRFWKLCKANVIVGQVKMMVDRNNLFHDSVQQIMKVNPVDLRRKLCITYQGEEGLDYGGISREWFFKMSHELLNPMNRLFKYVSNENYTLQINPASSANPQHLKYFRFVGRFIAMALYHEKFMDCGFSLPFYKTMLNKKLSIKDIESVDPEFYNSLTYVRDNNVDESGLDLIFAQDFKVRGKLTQHELKEGGKDIDVTEENKMEYINLMTQWHFSRGVEKQTKAILEGFDEVIPLQWLKYFDERELEMMVCGMQEIDVDDWANNTEYEQYTSTSEQVEWFWRFVREINNEKRGRLLQFVTGTCRLPVGGFVDLRGSNGPEKFCIAKVGEETSLPRSHTCFNKLDLPPYSSYEQLVEKVTMAIEETQGFGQI